jgi:hypothetical protein
MLSMLAKKSRAFSIVAVVALALSPIVASSASATGSPVPTAAGSWGTLTMPASFSPNAFGPVDWFGADGAGNVYWVPYGGRPTSAPQARHANARTSHGLFNGIYRYTPSTGQTTYIDPSRFFGDMSGLAVEASGAIDIVTNDIDLGRFVVMHVSPTGTETVLNSTIPALASRVGIAVDAVGDVFVSSYVSGTSSIYEIPSGGGAATLVATVSSDVVSGLAVAPDGTLYATSGPLSGDRLYAISAGGTVTPVAFDGLYAYGLAIDGAGNLFSALGAPSLVEELSVSGASQYLPVSPAYANVGSTTPLLLAYGGGTLYMWDASSSAPPSGVRSNIPSGSNVLYTWSTSGARPFLTNVDAVAARAQGRYTQSITATWTGGGPTYRCTLMSGYNSPTQFTVLTTTHSCTFYGLAIGTSFGISVVSISGGVASAPQVGFAPAPRVTITCVLRNRGIHRTGVNPHCPPGWRQV